MFLLTLEYKMKLKFLMMALVMVFVSWTSLASAAPFGFEKGMQASIENKAFYGSGRS